MFYRLSPKTENAKLGLMAATMSSRETCPDTCPLKNNGCYSNLGPISWIWNKLTAGRGDSFDVFIEGFKKLPKGYAVRVSQAGDLPGVNCKIDAPKLRRLTKAVKHLTSWTYTHKPVFKSKKVKQSLVKSNRAAIKEANAAGFAINISTNKLSEVDAAIKLGIGPVVTILALGSANTVYTKGGIKVIKCPAQYRDTTCAQCQLCAKIDRSVVVGFEAHGTNKNQVSRAALA